MRRLAVVVAAVAVAACGRGAPGGFPAAVEKSSGATATTNTIREGSPAPPPTLSPPPADTTVSVNLVEGRITPSVKEVKVRKVAFAVSNDEEVARRMRVTTVGGTTLVGTDPIPPGEVRNLVIELAPGPYRLVSEGGGRPDASADFAVAPA